MVFGSSLSYNTRLASTFASLPLQISFLLFIKTCSAIPSLSALNTREDAERAAQDPADLKPIAANRYLPAQIGGIVGSYAVSLVLVAAALLLLSKRRREHLTAGENETEFLSKVNKPQQVEGPPEQDYPDHWKELQLQQLQDQHQQHEIPASPTSLPRSIPRSPVVLGLEREYSPDIYQHPDAWPIHAAHPSLQFGLTLDTTTAPAPGPSRANYILPSPSSTTRSPLGYDESVDQAVVEKDRQMAQSQLEEMYKYAFEHEEAKLKGVDAPPIPMDRAPAPRGSVPSMRPSTAGTTASKKERNKPAALNLSGEPERQSRVSSLFSALRSPKKNKVQGVSISSPIMTPMSGTFPRESQEMNTIPPRQYAPAPPPPVPTDQLPFRGRATAQYQPLTPDYSPDSSQSIDERLGAMGNMANHSRNPSSVPTEPDPTSAVSDNSQTPLVGLPSSPKPGVNRFPSLPASPRPGQQTFNLPASPRPGQQTFGLPTSPQPSQTSFNLPSSPQPGSSFSRPNAPSAVRTGGALPLRAYEPALSSPSVQSTQTKQTVFERMAPLSPRGAMTPYTGTAVPYSPYQPFSPCVPVTPSLVTKADRKRMKKLEPKTPTLAMVKSDEEIW